MKGYQMKNYPIRLFFNAYIDIEVKAESELKAYKDMAYQAMDNMSHDELLKQLKLQFDFAEVIS
jgi:hypothetical protein